MKKNIFITIITATVLLMSACGSSNVNTEQLQSENESLKAQLSEAQESNETAVQLDETTVTSTVSETESVTTTITEEIMVVTEEVNVDYRPGMYLEYVRPCAENIGKMSQSELESLLTDVEDIKNTDNDKYCFYEFGDAEYTYTVRISKSTGNVDLVAISLFDFSFNVYINYDGSKITYSLNGEYGTGITKDFDKEADSLEESEQFIFKERLDYLNVNNDNPETISLDEYNQLELGMSYSDVAFIIGGYGNKISESKIDGFYSSVYCFDGEGDVGANAVLMFQNGELYSMAQAGLK